MAAVARNLCRVACVLTVLAAILRVAGNLAGTGGVSAFLRVFRHCSDLPVWLSQSERRSRADMVPSSTKVPAEEAQRERPGGSPYRGPEGEPSGFRANTASPESHIPCIVPLPRVRHPPEGSTLTSRCAADSGKNRNHRRTPHHHVGSTGMAFSNRGEMVRPHIDRPKGPRDRVQFGAE